MSDRFRLMMAQLNPIVGDLTGNLEQARKTWERAKNEKADFVAFPEMFATGYQLQDLVMKPAFARDTERQIKALAASCADGPAFGIGGPKWPQQQETGGPIWGAGKPYNAYYICDGGEIVATILKHELPNYAVFDEKRYYHPGPLQGPVLVRGVRIGFPICEDAWFEDVCETLAESGAELFIMPNGSPYHRGKTETRQNVIVSRVIETGLPAAYVNLLGGQDDQVFDGASFVLNPHGHLTHQAPQFEEAEICVDFERLGSGWEALEGEKSHLPEPFEADYHAMVLALRDYLGKSGFKRVVLGLSGGIDSALVAAIAADALGPEAVHCVMLPSQYTSETSLDDAREVATRIGCRLDTIPISPARQAVTESLAPLFEGLEPDVTEENIQSRLRGVMLMALSNKLGSMLLTTGNKSEVAVGYATIYGDMAGGYNPIKDLYKTRVFETCRWRNANHRSWMKGPDAPVIPQRVIDKPPTAELREDQKDEDSLPPYDELDVMLEMLIDQERSVAEVVAAGFDATWVKKVERLIYLSEYKRFQSAPGVRLTEHAFWLDRRYPIVNKWRDQGES